MPNNKISPEVLSTAHSAIRRDAGPQVSFVARLAARLQAGRFDRMIAVGVPAPAGTALAAHEARLTSSEEREAIARSLRQTVHDAHNGGTPLCSRIPVHRENIAAAEDVIDAITRRLYSPRPVSPRGMARLRHLMSDGTGPMYRYGKGDLAGRLGAALAEL